MVKRLCVAARHIEVRCEVCPVSRRHVLRHGLLHRPLSPPRRVSEAWVFPLGSYSLKSPTSFCAVSSCSGMAALRKGNATSDSVCESNPTVSPQAETAHTPASRSTAAAPSSRSTAPLRSTAQPVRPSVSEEPFTYLTKSPPPPRPYSKPGTVTDFLTTHY